MKKYLLLLAVLLGGCSTPVPIVPKFPSLPEEIAVMCTPLKKIPEEAVLSEIAKTITENYTLYHICSANNDALLEWYTTQKKIFEELK
jgi:hypothetical protein